MPRFCLRDIGDQGEEQWYQASHAWPGPRPGEGCTREKLELRRPCAGYGAIAEVYGPVSQKNLEHARTHPLARVSTRKKACRILWPEVGRWSMVASRCDRRTRC